MSRFATSTVPPDAVTGPDFEEFLIRFQMSRLDGSTYYTWARFGDYMVHQSYCESRRTRIGWTTTFNWLKARRFASADEALSKLRQSGNLRKLSREHPWAIISYSKKTAFSSEDPPLLQLARCAD